MKKLLMAAVLLCASTVIFAQNQERRGGNRQFNPEEFAKRQTEWMKTELKLTDKQTKQVDSINLVYAKKQQELFPPRQNDADGSQTQQTDEERQAAREKRMKQMQELNEKKEAAFAKVLTKEQLETYKKKAEEMRSQFGRGRRGEGGGQPQGESSSGSRPTRPSRNSN